MDVVLRDGRTLHAAIAKGFLAKVVMVKFADGATTVPYDQFPDPYRDQLLQKRPAPRDVTPIANGPAKAPPAKPRPAPDRGPKTFHGLLLDGARPHGQFAEISVRNPSASPQICSPSFFVAETSDGTLVTGVDFVGLSSEGKVSAVLKKEQVVDPRESLTLTVVFHRPNASDAEEFRNVDWRR